MISFIIPFKVSKENTILLQRALSSLSAVTINGLAEIIIVADNDFDIDLIQEDKVKVIVYSRCSLYEALNYGIKNMRYNNYIVMGADDIFLGNIDKLLVLCSLIEKLNLDFITFPVSQNNTLLDVNRGQAWLRGERAYISNHSCGIIFSKKVHHILGYYDTNLKIASDSKFMWPLIQRKQFVQFHFYNSLFEVSLGGVSNTNFNSAVEFRRVQIENGFNSILQYFLYILRIFRLWARKL